jgi:DNA-binding XRE family transcriptional regulator
VAFSLLSKQIGKRYTETNPKALQIAFSMPRPLQLGTTAPFVVKDGAQRIGERLSMARKRRRLTLRELAAKAGISYDTARAVEAGNLQTGLGAYLAMLWAMGLESEILAFADPDRDDEGKQLEASRLPQRVRHGKATVDGDF